MNKNFDQYGLKHSLEHLREIYKTIHLLAVEKQANYADLVCIENVNENWMMKDLRNLNFIKEKERFNEYLTTSVGNIAYMALHCRDNEVRVNCWALLHQYKLWRIEQNGNLSNKEKEKLKTMLI